MGRASIAIGCTDGSSGVLDRSAAGGSPRDGESAGDLRLRLGRTGQILPAASPAEAWPIDQEGPEEAGQEVGLEALWFQLPPEERARFGGCFSRMVLKVLKRRGVLERKEAA